MTKNYPVLSRLLLATVLLLVFWVSAVQASSATVYHTVVFWLKPDTPQATLDAILDSVQSMEDLPMVEAVYVGTPVMSERDVVDDSFGVAFTMTFKDEAALQAYNADPDHKRSSAMTLPHVARGIIYDYKRQ